ncbi:MAG: lysine--tRNA ligase, partial [Chitinivibrionales bacterium]|nr:lysine--tRNA ligase [Chitinivibrionales bacterium]MBD3396207.1 lysine--tRNA ligase [Chitinivibrionales bacterium]
MEQYGTALPDEQNEQMQVRLQKAARLREAGVNPYPDRYERSHTLQEAGGLADGTGGVRVAGRVVAIRYFGKLAFGHLHDFSGRMQFALQKGKLGDRFGAFKHTIDIGDFVGITGEIMTSKTGEKTVDADEWMLLAKALRPLPEKFHGLADPERKLRQRYLDLVMSPGVLARFKKRTLIIK